MRDTPVIPIDERLEQILDKVSPLEALDVTLGESRGGLVAADVVATKPWPHYSSCSTAGFAARGSDSTQGSLLSVVGQTSSRAVRASIGVGASEADAGEETPPNKRASRMSRMRRGSRRTKVETSDADTTETEKPDAETTETEMPDTDAPGTSVVGRVDAGQAMEVEVGAPLPAGADLVIPFDAVSLEGDSLVLDRTVESGTGVSMEGSVAEAGTLLISEHTRIDDRIVGVLASIGLARVAVVPRPRVVVVSVGNDLVSDAMEMGASHKHDATSALLASAAATAGAVTYRVAPVPDVTELVAESLDDQLIRADVIVVCGPVASSSDTIRDVLERAGDVSYDDGSTNLGAFGTGFLGDAGTHVISLPRDPAAAYLLFRILVDPIIAGMLGFGFPESGTVALDLDTPRLSDQTQYVLASVDDEGRAKPMAGGPPSLLDLQRADAVIRLLPGSEPLQAGSTVAALRLISGSGRR
jgi:molybdopterin molybdotransferase